MAEERKEGKVGWSIYSGYMKAAGGYIISFIVILSFILSIGAQTMTNWWLSHWLNQGSGVSYIFIDFQLIDKHVVENLYMAVPLAKPRKWCKLRFY